MIKWTLGVSPKEIKIEVSKQPTSLCIGVSGKIRDGRRIWEPTKEGPRKDYKAFGACS